MAKKEAKKVVDVCKKCGKAPCACVKEEKLIQTKDAQGRTWLVDNEGNKIKRV